MGICTEGIHHGIGWSSSASRSRFIAVGYGRDEGIEIIVVKELWNVGQSDLLGGILLAVRKGIGGSGHGSGPVEEWMRTSKGNI